MLTSNFGTWNVVRDPAASPTTTTAGANASETDQTEDAGSVGEQPRDDDLELATGDQDQPRPTKPKVDWSNFEPVTHEQFERMKRKSRSPLWSMLQVALGGLAAIPIALLLLWHVLDKDVVGAGPAVAQYVPWIVPEKFRGTDDLASVDDSVQPRPRNRVPQRGASGFRQFDDVLPPTPATDDATVSAEESDEVMSGNASPNDPAAAAMTTPGRQLSAPGDNGPAPKPITSSPSRNSSQPGENEGSGPPQESTPEASANIFDVIRSCENDLENWRRAVLDGEDLKPPARKLYQGLIDLAGVIQMLPEGNPVLRNVRDAVQPIGRDIKRNRDVQAVVEQGAMFWCEEHATQADLALALVVDIRAVSEIDGLWQLESAESSPLPKSVGSVVIPTYLAPSLIPGQRLLLLGTLHSDPKQESTEQPAPETGVFTACYLHAL